MTNVVCPYCQEQMRADLPDGYSSMTCPSCEKTGAALYTKIRAKRSRSERGGRSYSVRVVHGGKEELLEYFTRNWFDFELRSGDRAVFGYNGKGFITTVQNLTIGHFMTLKNNNSYAWLWLWVSIFIVFAAIFSYVFFGVTC